MAPLPSFSQTMCRAIQVYHLSEAICFSVQNSNGIKTRILLMFAFLTGIPTDKKLRIVIFQFTVKILVRKAVGIRNLPEIRLQFKSEKQSALPTKHIHTHKATHTVLFSYKKKGFNVYRFVNRIEIMPPVIR